MKDIPTPVGERDDAKHLEATDAIEEHTVVRLGPPWVKEPGKATMMASRLAEQRTGTVRRSGEINQLLALKGRQEEFETEIIATPATSWIDASERARYLIGLLLTTSAARTPRRKKLIANVLEDLRRLSVVEVDAEQ